MGKHNMQLIALLSSLIAIAICAAVLLSCVLAYGEGYADKRAAQIKESIISCVAQCYALEGRYPADLSYLEEHYGLQLDKEDYTFHYELFASNIFPGIRVIAKG